MIIAGIAIGLYVVRNACERYGRNLPDKIVKAAKRKGRLK